MKLNFDPYLIPRGAILFALALGICIGLCFCTHVVTLEKVISSVNIIGGISYDVTFLTEGEEVYVDRPGGQTVAGIPYPFQEKTVAMVKFANDDKGFAGETYALMELMYDAHVFIAYDSRGIPPVWIRNHYDSVGVQILATDPGADTLAYDLYGREFGIGIHTLGGNMAPNAQGAGSNYFVLLDFSDPLSFTTDLAGYVIRFYSIVEEPDTVDAVSGDGTINFQWEAPLTRLPLDLQENPVPVGTRIEVVDSVVFSSSPAIYVDSTGTYSWGVTLPDGFYEATLTAIDIWMHRSNESNGVVFEVAPDSVRAPPNLPLRFRKN